MLTLLAVGTLAGCSGAAASPDVSNSIRKSLDQAGFKDVSVSQDRDKGIVTLSGQVASDSEKSQAETLAKSIAGAQVVADQIAVIPVEIAKEAKAVNSALGEGIEKNLDAALIQNNMHDNVKYEVKSGVVTLTGEVNSPPKRDHAEKVATRVPNVQQVVNDLQVKNQKPSSSQQMRGVSHCRRTAIQSRPCREHYIARRMYLHQFGPEVKNERPANIPVPFQRRIYTGIKKVRSVYE